tara:strand:+ start:4691 stop:5563 length:873 start_codon:yes stop_codon:yes gene_type:complete
MIKILQGDCLDKLKELPDQSIHTCVTSPPYFNLRNYNDEDKQLGMEDTPEQFVNNLVQVFREVKRVLRDDGTVWLNLGDSFLPNKQLGCIPFKVAIALQQDNWILRQDIIWHKPNPMPESVKDRCTKAHEYIFLFSKSCKYYFDNEAIKEPSIYAPNKTHEVEREKGYYKGKWSKPKKGSRHDGSFKAIREKRNKRSVWTVTTKPFKNAHFATFPMDLIEPCVLAGCPVNGTVLDPFGGSGTTGIVANNHNRKAVLIELNSEYIEIARQRIEEQGNLFCDYEIEWSENGL